MDKAFWTTGIDTQQTFYMEYKSIYFSCNLVIIFLFLLIQFCFCLYICAWRGLITFNSKLYLLVRSSSLLTTRNSKFSLYMSNNSNQVKSKPESEDSTSGDSISNKSKSEESNAQNFYILKIHLNL